jgi:3-hydroxyacyl-CoA dehydrogenase
MVLEGAAPADVDRVMTAFGFPMGPFAMADLAGLDLGWDPSESKGESLRALLCEAGRHGQKTGAGFYDYDGALNPMASPAADELLAQWRAKNAITARTIPDREILERCLYPLINEGAKILEEGVAARASDIDVIWLNGYGFPAYRGGPMYYAGTLGLGAIAAGLRAQAIAPAPLLERLAGENRSFTDR